MDTYTSGRYNIYIEGSEYCWSYLTWLRSIIKKKNLSGGNELGFEEDYEPGQELGEEQFHMIGAAA